MLKKLLVCGSSLANACVMSIGRHLHVDELGSITKRILDKEYNLC